VFIKTVCCAAVLFVALAALGIALQKRRRRPE
jgi:MYXO-CTERM domain-containing protein